MYISRVFTKTGDVMYMIATKEADDNPLLFFTYKRALEYRFSVIPRLDYFVKPIQMYGSDYYCVCDVYTNQPLPGSVTDDPLMAENIYKTTIEMSQS